MQFRHRCLLLRALLLLAAFPLAGAGPAVLRNGPVTVQIVTSVASVRPGMPFEAGVRLTMDPGWHTYWKNPGDAGLATTVEWSLPEGYSAGPLRWPLPRPFREQDFTTYGYEGDVLLVAEITPPQSLPGGAPVLAARVTWLACRVECVPGSVEVSLDLSPAHGGTPADQRTRAAFQAARDQVPVVDPSTAFSASTDGGALVLRAAGLAGQPGSVSFFPDATGVINISAPQDAAVRGGDLLLRLARPLDAGQLPSRLQGVLAVGTGADIRALLVDVPIAQEDAVRPAAGGVSLAGLLAALALAFLGGILLNLMPCVLPVLSLKVLGLVRHAQGDRRAAVAHGLVFTAGVLVSFWVIAGLLIALRAGGQLLGWGFQFQSPGIVTAAALLFFIVGLNLFGVFEIGAGAAAAGARLSGRQGWAGSFLGGLLATAVATPCTAPFMGSALGYALTLPPFASLAVFTALGLGMAAPYLVLSALPGLVRHIPRPGRWMETLKQVMGFPMMAAAVWMASVLLALSGPGPLVFLLGALVASGVGAWVWGRWGGVDKGRGTRVAAGIIALALVASSAVLAVRTSAGAAPSVPPAAAAGTGSAAAKDQEGWEPWSAARVEDLRRQGRPVFIDFSARWCLTCQVNERVALSRPQVRQAFRDRDVALLKADWTDRSEAIASALSVYGRAGVPLYVLYGPGKSEPVLLPEVLTPGIVLSALEKLSAR